MVQVQTLTQISAGGVAFRERASRLEVALIQVGDEGRWQLPKGLVDEGEAIEAAALREVREEAGLETEITGPIETIEYWYYATRGGQRVRFHKFVHFYLMRFISGDVRDHDHEVREARWFEIGEATRRLSFASERKIVEQAKGMLQSNA
jgi:8-oxo-dGTP pyrophosphatase MutT (NUDIX family)